MGHLMPLGGGTKSSSWTRFFFCQDAPYLSHYQLEVSCERNDSLGCRIQRLLGPAACFCRNLLPKSPGHPISLGQEGKSQIQQGWKVLSGPDHLLWQDFPHFQKSAWPPDVLRQEKGVSGLVRRESASLGSSRKIPLESSYQFHCSYRRDLLSSSGEE